MNMMLLITLCVLEALSLTGCRQVPASAPTPRAEYRKITAQEAKAMLDKEPAIKLVDVRTEEEYRERRIANSLLLPDYDVEKLAPQLLPKKDEKILVYCRSGRRSHGAVMTLVALGYTNVYDFGGIIDWPYETVTGK